MFIPTVFVTDTMDSEATMFAQRVIAKDEDTGAPELHPLEAEALPERTSPPVQTTTSAPIQTSTSTPIQPTTSALVQTGTVTPAVTATPDTHAAVATNSATSPAAAPTPTSEPLPVAQLTEVPLVPTESPAEPHVPIMRLVIPAIGVDAEVETRSVDSDGAMQTPGGPAVVSWYDFSSQPQDDGNAVFAGHLDYAGYGPAVFWDLRALAAGDVIEVHQQDGNIVQYRVTEVRPFAATDDAGEVVSSKGRPTITLITCDGTFDSNQRAYDQRLVVTGDRID